MQQWFRSCCESHMGAGAVIAPNFRKVKPGTLSKMLTWTPHAGQNQSRVTPYQPLSNGYRETLKHKFRLQVELSTASGARKRISAVNSLKIQIHPKSDIFICLSLHWVQEKQGSEWHINAVLRRGGSLYELSCVLRKNVFSKSHSALSALGWTLLSAQLTGFPSV